jgi:hypothetical protein
MSEKISLDSSDFIHRYEIQGGSCVFQCKCNIDV